MQENSSLLTISQASKYLGVSKDTLRRWEKKKILKPFRSPSGWRYYNKKQLDYVYTKKPDFNSNIKAKDVPLPIAKTVLDKARVELPKKTSILISFFVFFLFLALGILGFYLYQYLLSSN
ncbi:MerR family DNA-binding transcriptional regulator [Patescibacteria group bacterium]